MFKLDIISIQNEFIKRDTTDREFSADNRCVYRVSYRIKSHEMNLIDFVWWEFLYKIRWYIQTGKGIAV